MPTGIGSKAVDPLNEVDTTLKKNSRPTTANIQLTDVIAREELCQFASIVMEVEPAWRKLLGLSLFFNGWNVLVIYYWAVLLHLYLLLFVC
jgi:hypothetical protein